MIESTWQDNTQPLNFKDIEKAYVASYPISSGCSLTLSVAPDYGSYQTMQTAGGVAMNILNAVRAIFRKFGANPLNNKLVYKWKVAFTSSGAVAAQLTAVGIRIITKMID